MTLNREKVRQEILKSLKEAKQEGKCLVIAVEMEVINEMTEIGQNLKPSFDRYNTLPVLAVSQESIIKHCQHLCGLVSEQSTEIKTLRAFGLATLGAVALLASELAILTDKSSETIAKEFFAAGANLYESMTPQDYADFLEANIGCMQ